MGTKRHEPEDVIAKLRQVDVLVGVWLRNVVDEFTREGLAIRVAGKLDMLTTDLTVRDRRVGD